MSIILVIISNKVQIPSIYIYLRDLWTSYVNNNGVNCDKGMNINYMTII